MLISEMIHRLELLKAGYGDIKVLYTDFDFCREREPEIALDDKWTNENYEDIEETVVKISYSDQPVISSAG